MVILQSLRDLRDFIAAKKRKKEPILWRIDGVGAASCHPSDAKALESLRASLRNVRDWGLASERLDALESALKKRHNVGLPLPNEVIQNSDKSISLFWTGVMVRCFTDGFFSMIGGAAGPKAKAITNDLLDVLAFQVKIQRAS